MVRELDRGDTAETLRLLRRRPIQNVYLEYLVRLGALGAMPGFLGYFKEGRLEGALLIAATGATSLEVRDPAGFVPLAAAAAESSITPRHIIGPEEVTTPFWEAYAERGPTPIWERRELVYVLEREARRKRGAAKPDPRFRRATERDLDAIVENSARQYVEDLGVDRRAQDPGGFRERHHIELRDGRWWVLRERGSIVLQLHVGPENDHVIQIGGVFTPPELRRRGYATRGVAAAGDLLLERCPAVSLFCAEDNRAARQVYERIGFEPRFYYRSWLLS